MQYNPNDSYPHFIFNSFFLLAPTPGRCMDGQDHVIEEGFINIPGIESRSGTGIHTNPQ